MSFFTKLLLDAQPKAEAIQRVTSRVADKASNNPIVNVVKNISYSALVNTIGIGVVLVRPAVTKAGSYWDAVVAKANKLAEPSR